VYRAKVPAGSRPAHTNFYVSYYADTALTRIDSCRDKLALAVWAHFSSFNPEREREVLDYGQVCARLGAQVKFGLRLRGSEPFRQCLAGLRTNEFQKVEEYRHLKIHRREPRIELHGVKPHHDWEYFVPLVEPSEISRWKKRLQEQYPGPEMKFIERGCYVRGVPYDRRRLKGRLWNYGEVDHLVEHCLSRLMTSSTGCFRLLRGRAPFRANK
jgi:hypothetical protein